jgi:16S rRNA (adenine1518-N6/adenine1519-N6)-dimethyltransferase
VTNADAVDRVVFMIQDEVAQRLTATAGTKEWGALTVFVRAAFAVRRVLKAPPGAFHPPPDVTSAVVELLPLRPPRARETESFRVLVRGAFQARRKMLRNAWAAAAPDVPSLERAARDAGIDLTARGKTLEIEAFARMAAELDALHALDEVNAPRREPPAPAARRSDPES